MGKVSNAVLYSLNPVRVNDPRPATKGGIVPVTDGYNPAHEDYRSLMQGKGVCDAIICDHNVCDTICGAVCDTICGSVCDRICDKICDTVCDNIRT